MYSILASTGDLSFLNPRLPYPTRLPIFIAAPLGCLCLLALASMMSDPA